MPVFDNYRSTLDWFLGPEPAGRSQHLGARWIFLRALGLIYFSAFYSLLFQIKGLIGPDGLLPARDFLEAVSHYFNSLERFWYVPSLLWFRSGDRMLATLCWAGILASILLIANVWPRGMLAVCFVAYLSFVSAARDFSGYQSDGMLLEAGLISMFFAPPGFWPGLGRSHAPSRASLFLLRWEWFRIYFESGVAKIASGDQSWRHLTAMDDYYQNGPLPTWIGWYAQQLPHWFHASTAFFTLFVETLLVWMLFLPRRFRIVCFFIVTPFEISIILTANYTFLNYLVLSLGFLLLDDEFLVFVLPARWKGILVTAAPSAPSSPSQELATVASDKSLVQKLSDIFGTSRLALAAFLLAWIFYASSSQIAGMLVPSIPLPQKPGALLEPFRVADQYGLFANMTHERREIEFQGSRDGKTWIAYPFRYKPQEISKPPGIYAPYQPRFDWNLWFASLGPWRGYPFVVYAEERLLKNSPDVVALFAGNPFDGSPPTAVRAILWQYWFTDAKERKETNNWWRREELGLYCPALQRHADGTVETMGSGAEPLETEP
jgi:lipase maturation factor 1